MDQGGGLRPPNSILMLQVISISLGSVKVPFPKIVTTFPGTIRDYIVKESHIKLQTERSISCYFYIMINETEVGWKNPCYETHNITQLKR